MRPTSRSLALLATLALVTPSSAAADDEQTIRENAAAYADAFNKQDSKALTALWAPNGVYVDQDGNATKGRPAILAQMKTYFENAKGAKLAIKVTSVRLIQPNVALEDGTTELASPDDEPQLGRYTAAHVKINDKWVLTSVHELESSLDNPAPQIIPHSERLQDLDAMVGSWTAQGEDFSVTADAQWTPNHNYLIRKISVTAGDGSKVMDVTQRIGWSPIRKQIKSWVFDSEGGYAEGLWSRTADGWAVVATGVLTNGHIASSSNLWSQTDKDTILWRSVNRQIDGKVVPDVEVTFQRKSADKVPAAGGSEN